MTLPAVATDEMSESQSPRNDNLRELFVSVTGGETVTERQEEGPSKQPIESDDAFDGVDDGLDDAVGADVTSE